MSPKRANLTLAAAFFLWTAFALSAAFFPADVFAAVIGIADLDPIKATPEVLIGRVIKSVLGITGTLALLIIMYAGITWMFARGESKKVETAKDTIFWAVMGLAVVFTSYAIVNFVLSNIQQGMSSGRGAGGDAVQFSEQEQRYNRCVEICAESSEGDGSAMTECQQNLCDPILGGGGSPDEEESAQEQDYRQCIDTCLGADREASACTTYCGPILRGGIADENQGGGNAEPDNAGGGDGDGGGGGGAPQCSGLQEGECRDTAGCSFVQYTVGQRRFTGCVSVQSRDACNAAEQACETACGDEFEIACRAGCGGSAIDCYNRG